jgi:hypothetical protein
MKKKQQQQAHQQHRPAMSDAMEIACISGNTAEITRRLDANESIDCVDSTGWTPLMNVVFYGLVAAATMLIARGADPSIVSMSGRSALVLARMKRVNQGCVDLLTAALASQAAQHAQIQNADDDDDDEVAPPPKPQAVDQSNQQKLQSEIDDLKKRLAQASDETSYYKGEVKQLTGLAKMRGDRIDVLEDEVKVKDAASDELKKKLKASTDGLSDARTQIEFLCLQTTETNELLLTNSLRVPVALVDLNAYVKKRKEGKVKEAADALHKEFNAATPYMKETLDRLTPEFMTAERFGEGQEEDVDGGKKVKVKVEGEGNSNKRKGGGAEAEGGGSKKAKSSSSSSSSPA